MSDITKCDGKGCDLKEKCYRFTANDGFRQSYFAEPPIKDGKCDMFWGDSQDRIYKQLKDIVNGKY